MNAEPHIDLYTVYENCDPEYLRNLREAAGMDETTLARIACLSLAQVRQLQENSGDGLFYSFTIKRQAYKRLLMILGADPPPPPPAVAFAQTATNDRDTPGQSDAMLDRLDRIVAMSKQTETMPGRREHLGAWVQTVKMFLWTRRQLIGSFGFLVLAVGALTFIQVNPTALTVQPVSELMSQAAPASMAKAPINETTQASSFAPAGVSQAEPEAPAKPLNNASGECAFSEDKFEPLSPTSPNKASNYVHLMAESAVDVCVVDGSKKATLLHLKTGEGRSVYGVAPWQLSSESFQKLQIFFQGWRINVPPQTGQHVLLVETHP